MPEILAEALLTGLSPEPVSDRLAEIRSGLAADRRKVVVLDDDPTGTQTVHGISVLTGWSMPELAYELKQETPGFYILTNTRSLSLEAAQTLNRRVAANLKEAARVAGVDFTLISRSDSTLRSHFLGEVDVLMEELGGTFDGLIVAPYFRQGGRITVGDTHYVISDDNAVPAAETEFARDAVFGYSHSDLRLWVEEKSRGRIQSAEVVSLSISDIRCRRCLPKLIALHDRQVLIVNAAVDSDIEGAAAELLQAEQAGKRFMVWSAASFVRARMGLSSKPLLTAGELDADSHNGGMVVVGSHVARSSAQLAFLRQRFDFHEIELNVPDLLENHQRQDFLEKAQEDANLALSAGKDVLLFSSRRLVKGSSPAESLQISQIVSNSLVSFVNNLQVKPRFFLTKGGITSSDVATRGLRVQKAHVMGQILPGVPVWKLGDNSRFPGMALIIFPGNVGSESALADVVAKFERQKR